MSKPVEIEFLMKDKLSAGIDNANAHIDTLIDNAKKAAELVNAKIAEQHKVIDGVSSDLSRMERQLAGMKPGTAQKELAADVVACRKVLDEERSTLAYLEKQHRQAEKAVADLEKEHGKLSASSTTAATAQKTLAERIAESKDLVKYTTSCIKELEKAYKNAAPGNAQNEALIELNAAKKALEEEKLILASLTHEQEENRVSNKRLAMQLRELQDAMAKMRLEGKQDTDEYREMAEKAAELSDTISDLREQTKILSNDDANLEGFMSGVSGLSGLFTAATGAVSLFAGENENLAKIQARVQSVMAVTMGLQQVFNTLNKDSAFRLVTVVKMKNLLTAANTRLSAALGISTAAASALMATLTLGLSAAITGLIVLFDKYSDAQEAARQKAQELIEVESDGRAQMIKTRFEIENTIRELKEFTGSKEEEKKKTEELNRKYGEAFGYYDTVAEWYDVLTQKAADYIQMLFLQAKAQALVNKAVEADDKVNKLKATDADDVDGSMGWFKKSLLYWAQADTNGQIDASAVIKEENEKNKKKAIADAEKVRDDLLKQAEDLTKEMGEIGKTSNIGGHVKPENKTTGSTGNSNKDRQKELEREKAAEQKRVEELAQLRQEIEQKSIDVLADGSEKRIRQIKYNYQKEENEIKALATKWREAQGGNLTDEQSDALKERLRLAQEEQSNGLEEIEKETAKTYQDLLEKYQDYEEQRKSIREKFAKDRENIGKATDASGAPLDDDAKQRALAELGKQEKAALKAVDEAQLSELSEENKALVDMFADTSSKSVAEIQKIIDRIKLLMDYLRATKDGNGTAVIKDAKGNTTRTITQKDVAQLGFSAEELKVLENSPEKLKALTDQYDKLKKEVLSKNPFKALADSVADFFKKGEDGDEKTLEEKLKNLGESASAAADMVGDIAGKLSEMFEAAGNDSMAQAMSDVQDVMSSVSNIGKGFAQGGVVGGIAAAAGEAIGWVTKAFAASARHKAALEKIMQEVTAQQREYNLLLKEQNLEYEKAQTIFGTDTYGKAANAVKVMKESFADLKAEMEGTAAQQEKFEKKNTGIDWLDYIYNRNYSALKDAYSGLADIEIKTGHKKTGLFGWGKGKDVYSSILDVYPELIDSAGNLNRELAESILNSREFADNDKEALQYIIDLYDQAEDAWQEVKDYFEDIFGELGQSLTDALVDAFKNGTDAADAFADTVSEMLENLAEQMIYTVTLAPYLEKAQEEMLDVMKREDLTDEEKFSNYVSILDAMTDDVLNQQGTFNALMEEYKQKAKEKGFDLWEDSTSQSAKSGGYSAMTQDQGTKLEGLFTSGLQHWSSMDERLETVADRMNLAESHLVRIAENTGTSAGHLGEIKEEIKKIVRDGLKVK